MPCALLQRRLDVPEVESLRRAFQGVGGMTPADAPIVARDAFGILVKELGFEDAVALQRALLREGVETDVVDHADLPALPMARQFRRVAARECGFVGCDPCDRELTIPWDRLSVVSCGWVRHTEFHRRETPVPDFNAPGRALFWGGWELGMDGWPGNPTPPSPPRFSVSARERQVWRWTADLFLAEGAVRYSMRSDQIHLLDAPPAGESDPRGAFVELLRRVASRAGRAVLNRVAFALREGHADTIVYASRNAYQAELLWLLWRLKKAGRGG